MDKNKEPPARIHESQPAALTSANSTSILHTTSPETTSQNDTESTNLGISQTSRSCSTRGDPKTTSASQDDTGCIDLDTSQTSSRTPLPKDRMGYTRKSCQRSKALCHIPNSPRVGTRHAAMRRTETPRPQCPLKRTQGALSRAHPKPLQAHSSDSWTQRTTGKQFVMDDETDTDNVNHPSLTHQMSPLLLQGVCSSLGILRTLRPQKTLAKPPQTHDAIRNRPPLRSLEKTAQTTTANTWFYGLGGLRNLTHLGFAHQQSPPLLQRVHGRLETPS